MELSIIITSYRNPELLKLCAKSVRENYSGDFEVIVADSATEDETEMIMREDFPDVIFISNEDNVGFQQLVRMAYRRCTGKYILILNGDVVVKKDSIEKLLLHIKANPDVGVMGPKLLNFNDTFQYSCFRFYTPVIILYRRTVLGKFSFARKKLDWFLMKDYDHNLAREVDWIMGSALMTSREAIGKVGLMDPRFKMYFEDVDWCRRFWENGYKVVYFPESQMYHYHGRGSTGKNILKTLVFNKLAWLHISSAIKYFLKYIGKPMPVHQ